MRLLKISPLVVVLALGGCGLFAPKSEGPLIPDARSPISDVPIPAGVTMMDDSSSKVITGRSLRVVDHGDKGSDDLLPVVTFYKNVMPGKDWTFVDQTQVSGKEITLHYTKKTEDCHVTVKRRTFDTTIRVRIDPVAK